MPRKNPLGKIRDAALETIKDPVGTAGKRVGQARDAVGLGKLVAEQVTKTAADTALKTAGAVTSRVPGRKPAREQVTPEPPAATRPTAVPDLEPAVPATESRKVHGDPVQPAARARTAGPAKTARPANPARKAASKAPGGRPRPVNVTRELGLDEAPVEKNPLPASQAPAQESAQESAQKTAQKTAQKRASTAKKTAAKATKQTTRKTTATRPAGGVDATPADVAEKVAKKAPAKKAAAKKAPTKKATKAPASKTAATTAPGAKLPTRKTAATSTQAPLSAAELAAGAGPEVITPVGTRGAGASTNPDTTDTDLQQVGTEPLVDPATTKAIASEQAQLSAAADVDKG